MCKNEFELIKDKIDTKITWAYPDNNFMYQICDETKIVGLIAFKESLSDCVDKIFIDNFFVFDKNKGIGGKIVKCLKNKYSEIELFPTQTSLKFWFYRGFCLTDDSGDNYIWRKGN